MRAADIMRTSFATVRQSAPLLDAIHLLLETNQRGLPVVDDAGSLVGIISEGDFLHRRELEVDYPEGFWLEWLLGKDEGQFARERTSGLRVDAVMSRHPVWVDDNAKIEEVVKQMDIYQISQVLVLRGKKLAGIIGRTQLLVALEQRLKRSTQELRQ